MRQIQIKTCFFCDKSGHLTKDCADLARTKQDHNFSNYINSPQNCFTATRRSKGNANIVKCETNNNIIITKEENKNNFKGSTNIKKNQDNNENINSNSKNKNIVDNSKNINNKINSHKIVKEEININESVKINGINNRTNKSVTSDFIKEVNIIDSNNSKVDNIQITSNANKNEQFINKNKIINVDSNKDIKIEEIKKKIKIKHICIQNNGKNKININKLMILKQPEIAFKGDY
ncbi:hypothetical protein H8356DRAFT_1089206 [Neocallimastix lanati (nom. inval.)]|nr:hypothetical protein H8356DRAFT_1089206 [Neocallimastix sp. JGI-2020a]